MYAIAGVSGHTGSAAADALLAQGKPVRVIVREAAKGDAWRAKGAEVAVASLDDVPALTRALAGVAGAYLLVPPDMTTREPRERALRLSRGYAAAVRAANVPHVVLLSSVGAQHPDGTGPIAGVHLAERELATTGAALTALRAAYFQENWGASLATLASGTVYTFVPTDLAFAQVSTRDIGRTAALALVEGLPRGQRQIIELAGLAEVTGKDVEAKLRAITGKPVNVVAAPLDAVVSTFTGFGISKEVAEEFREMYAGLISGRVAFEGGTARALRGQVPVEDTLAKMVSDTILAH